MRNVVILLNNYWQWWPRIEINKKKSVEILMLYTVYIHRFKLHLSPYIVLSSLYLSLHMLSYDILENRDF